MSCFYYLKKSALGVAFFTLSSWPVLAYADQAWSAGVPTNGYAWASPFFDSVGGAISLNEKMAYRDFPSSCLGRFPSIIFNHSDPVTGGHREYWYGENRWCQRGVSGLICDTGYHNNVVAGTCEADTLPDTRKNFGPPNNCPNGTGV